MDSMWWCLHLPGKHPEMPHNQFRVTLGTRDGRRVLTAAAEREAALMAESVLRRYAGEPLTGGLSVE